MRKLITISVLGLFVLVGKMNGQVNSANIWETFLNDVNIKYVYAINYDIYLPKPKFGKELKKLDGKEITVKGFYLPVDVTGNISVVSYNPMNMCFFCTGSGIETIIEINVADEHLSKFKKLKTDNYIAVKGILELNRNDYDHLIYILNEVELVETIK
jgi:hypothetical protein